MGRLSVPISSDQLRSSSLGYYVPDGTLICNGQTINSRHVDQNANHQKSRMSVHFYTGTVELAAKGPQISSDIGVLCLLWSQNDVIHSRLRLSATSSCFTQPFYTYITGLSHWYAVHCPEHLARIFGKWYLTSILERRRRVSRLYGCFDKKIMRD